MAFICLPQKAAREFRQALKDKEIKIADLLNMSSEERTTLLERYAGDQAKSVNTIFEEKLVLKNKIQGIKNWASKVGGIGRYDPTIAKQLQAMMSDFRAQQQERIFSPQENQAFLNDLADTALGTHITKAEAKNVFDLTTKTENLKKEFDGKLWSSDKARAEYGASKVVLEKYVGALKEGNQSVKAMVQKTLADFKETFKDNKPKAIKDLLFKTLGTISDNSIALVASLDNSFLGRQGLHTLMTHPTIWWDGASKSFVDFAKTLSGQNMKDALLADIYSNPNYINGSYDIAKLLPKSEEQYPTSLPERIWGLGRVFNASQAAFEGSAVRMRTGLYDLLARTSENNGVDMAQKENIKSLGKMINSLTARGQFGKTGESPIVRLVLWAPKMLKANFDVLTAHTGQDMAPFARKEAAVNLVKIVASTAAIMTIANAIKPGSAELDPRSSNFGKIKVGNTTFDFTGGAGSLIALGARLATNSSKSAGTGVVKPFGTDFGQQTRFDALIDFLAGKTTPPVGMLIDLMRGTDAVGKKVTPGGEAEKVSTPITIQNTAQLKDDHSPEAIAGVILDALGINANTSNQTASDWTQSPGVELQAFQKRVGDEKFKQANQDFNDKFSSWLLDEKSSEVYKSMKEDDKQALITKKKGDLQTQIFKQYGFTYKPPKKKK